MTTTAAAAAATAVMHETASSPRDDADALLVDGICALEDYLSEHERACEKLKQGFFKLTMARQHLPAYALSDLSYKELFAAATVVAPRATNNDNDDNDDSTASDVQWRLTTPDSDCDVSAHDASHATGLTHRKRGAQTDELVATTTEQQHTEQQQREHQNATILWFSSLPPSDLRHAQTHFRSALQALLYAATSASKVQRCVNALPPT